VLIPERTRSRSFFEMPDKTLSTTLSVTTFSVIAGAETEGSRPWERRMASPSASLGTSPLGKLGTSPAGSVLVGISLPPGAGTSASFGASGSLASLSNVLLKISAIPSFVLSNPLEARNPAHLPSLEGRDSKGRSESDARSGILKSNLKDGHSNARFPKDPVFTYSLEILPAYLPKSATSVSAFLRYEKLGSENSGIENSAL